MQQNNGKQQKEIKLNIFLFFIRLISTWNNFFTLRSAFRYDFRYSNVTYEYLVVLFLRECNCCFGLPVPSWGDM